LLTGTGTITIGKKQLKQRLGSAMTHAENKEGIIGSEKTLLMGKKANGEQHQLNVI
jgi:hypothetical protein